jgi:hypothetical protein
VTAAKKLPTLSAIAEHPADQDEEITVERRITVRAIVADATGPVTMRMTKIDAHLLAMARGEIEPDDPFGGLIPIYENDDEETFEVQADERWLSLAPTGAVEGLFGATVPSVRMRPHEIFALPLEARSVLFLWQIDGRRTVETVAALCGLDDLSTLEIIDELLRHGVIDLL